MEYKKSALGFRGELPFWVTVSMPEAEGVLPGIRAVVDGLERKNVLSCDGFGTTVMRSKVQSEVSGSRVRRYRYR